VIFKQQTSFNKGLLRNKILNGIWFLNNMTKNYSINQFM